MCRGVAPKGVRHPGCLRASLDELLDDWSLNGADGRAANGVEWTTCESGRAASLLLNDQWSLRGVLFLHVIRGALDRDLHFVLGFVFCCELGGINGTLLALNTLAHRPLDQV